MVHSRVTRTLRNPAPETKFAGVRFQAVTTRGFVRPWQPQKIKVARKVAGASFVKRQNMGFDLDRLETTVLLANADDGLAFINAQDTTGELWLPVGFVLPTRYDTIRHELGVDYAIYTDAHLDDVTDIELTREGWVKATAVFTREHVVTP